MHTILAALVTSTAILLGANGYSIVHRGTEIAQATTRALPALALSATTPAKSDVSVLTSRWYGRPSEIAPSFPCFHAMNDRADEIERYQLRCRKRPELANESGLLRQRN